MLYGLSENTINKIISIFIKYNQIEKVLLYGSRAKGTFTNGSDIDLTLSGTHLNLAILSKIENDIDDLLLPYSIDLSIYDQIDNEELLNHIRRIGIEFYKKESTK